MTNYEVLVHYVVGMINIQQEDGKLGSSVPAFDEIPVQSLDDDHKLDAKSSLQQDPVIPKQIEASYTKKTREIDDPKFVDLRSALKEIEDGGQATVDDLHEVNLRTDDDPKPTFANALLTEGERDQYQTLFQEFRDCFA